MSVRPEDTLAGLLDEATPRPWFNDEGDAVSSKAMYDPFTGDYHSTLFFEAGDPVDAALIVAAVNLSPAMVAVVRAAREMVGLWDRYEACVQSRDWQGCDMESEIQPEIEQSLRAALAALDKEDK